jgi:hypothetical protein
MLFKNIEMAGAGLEKGNATIKYGKNMAITVLLFKLPSNRSKVCKTNKFRGVVNG